MATVSGGFGDFGNSVDYTFTYLDNGLFEYEIENGDLDKEGTENILGLLFLRQPIGFCSFADLPKDIKEAFSLKLSPDELLKTKLVAKTACCDGLLVIFSNKSDWEEINFKAKMMIKERRGEL
jgi:hypothetical protein